MRMESLRSLMNEKILGNEAERNMAGLMFTHYDKIANVLAEPAGGAIKEAHWAMDWRKIEDFKKREVLVVAGMIPAVDENEGQIPEILATPTVFCIPKHLMKEDEWQLFDEIGDRNRESQSKRELLIRAIIHDPAMLKLYSLHGWGGNPYTSVMPMADLTGEHDAIAVLGGVMGSMGTMKSRKRVLGSHHKRAYGWETIRGQVIGMMYYLEGREMFQHNLDSGRKFDRVVIGHSMQGQTATKCLTRDRKKLPRTFFVPITPVLGGESKSARSLSKQVEYLKDEGRNVILGYDIPGRLMRVELATIGAILDEEVRRKILMSPLGLMAVKMIVDGYLRKENPYGEELIVLAHLIEYLTNAEAIINATHLLHNAEPAMGNETVHKINDIVDVIMLVYAGHDPVLPPGGLSALARRISVELRASVVPEGTTLVVSDSRPKQLRMCFFATDGHYLRKGSFIGSGGLSDELKVALR